MKLAVYAIAKDESKHVDRFLDAILPELKQGEGVYVTDTGSSDSTVDMLRSRGVTVDVWVPEKFRFDAARNRSLEAVPEDVDICLKMDLDEVLQPGWRDALEEAFVDNIFPIRQRINVLFHWNHHPDGTPDVTYWADTLVHSRHGYRWIKACHELLTLEDGLGEHVQASKAVIDHRADNTKPRSSYLELLAIDAAEQPDEHRAALYYGRQLWFDGHPMKALLELNRYLALSTAVWNVERCYAMRLIAKIVGGQGMHADQLAWLHRAVAECPTIREPWLELAEAYGENHLGKMFACEQALAITARPINYLSESRCWGPLLHDLLSVSAFYAGAKFKAIWHAMHALEMCPNDERLKNNLRLIQHEMMDPYATHQRLLAAAVARHGQRSVLECGAGWYSTPLLHGLCAAMETTLVTMESDPVWRAQFEYLASPEHVFVGSREEIPDGQWGVVFVDGRACDRPGLIEKYLQLSDVVVVHDAEDAANGYRQAVEAAPYSYVDKSRVPWTAVCSINPLEFPFGDGERIYRIESLQIP